MKNKRLWVAGGALAGGALAAGLCWLGGFDFDRRGDVTVLCTMLILTTAAAGGALAYFCSNKNES